MKPFGEDLKIIHDAVLLGREVGVGESFWRSLAYSEKLLRYFKKIVDLKNNTYEVEVDCTKSLLGMLDRGNYGYCNRDALELFQKTSGIGKINKKITFFPSDFRDTPSIVKEMEDWRCFPAKIEDLFAIGEKLPFLQREFAVYALGSVVKEHGDDVAPVLYLRNGSRAFSTAYLQKKWTQGCIFPAISNFDWM